MNKLHGENEGAEEEERIGGVLTMSLGNTFRPRLTTRLLSLVIAGRVLEDVNWCTLEEVLRTRVSREDD